MFSKILVANRGEIACRVIKTARRMGIKTVAVYSEADATALHVELADEKVAIGPAPSAESYLVIDRIVDACRETGAEAVHPGYGFLSENAAFQAALHKAGITFIGPDARAIAAMGDKIESKKLAHAAGVPTVPGHLGVIADEDEAIRIARDIGLPVMIKASAGGGGKGMRVAFDEAQVREGFRSARNEARSSFADDRVFIEKYIEEPRHIEIQVLADGHGTIVYLGERECSIQRRHQKIIEEAPSPFLDEETRRAMGEQAVALARAVGYRSAGTVEFIVDARRNFYFLEMNTRLQVEHPVTEMITGLDLVELMIRVAAGERLPIAQHDVHLDGWAMEARIYAEDPMRSFLPSIGRLTRFRPPEETGRVRVDTGVSEGSEISVYYDPMIAKLIVHGRDRDHAATLMGGALDAFQIRGVAHNVGFLAAVIAKPRFIEGRLSTNFIAEEFPDGFTGLHPDDNGRAPIIAVAAAVHQRIVARDHAIAGRGIRATGGGRRDWAVRIDRTNTPVTVIDVDGGVDVIARGARHEVRSDWVVGQTLWTGRVDGRSLTVQIDRVGVGYQMTHAGMTITVQVMTPRTAALADLMPVKQPPDLSRFLLSPMPGLLVSVAVKVGAEVKAGQELAVVEAMKMENVLKADADGVVAKIHATAGESLTVDQAILEFE